MYYSYSYSYSDEESAEFTGRLCAMILFAMFFIYSPLWMSLWLVAGLYTVALRIYATGSKNGVMDWGAYVFSEIIAGWKTGFIFWTAFILWPFVLVWQLLLARIFGAEPMTLVRRYGLELFDTYRSGGKYSGIRVETAREWSDAGETALYNKGKHAARAVRELPQTVERKSRLAIAIASVFTFLTAPLSFVRAQEKDEQKVSGFVISDVMPKFGMSAAVVGVDGRKGNIEYFVEGNFVKSQILRRGFVSYHLGTLSFTAGQQLSPTLYLLPAPPNGPFVQNAVINDEVTFNLSGVTVEYNDSSTHASTTLAQNNEDARFFGVFSRQFGWLKAITAVDRSRSISKSFVQLIANVGPFKGVLGGISSSNDLTGFAVCIAEPVKGVQLVSFYERTSWRERLKNKFILGFNLLFEGVRLRTTLATDDYTWQSQVTYSF